MDQNNSVTQSLAKWVCEFNWEDVSPSVQASVNSSFINWFGCALGGSQDPVVAQCLAAVADLNGAQHVNVIGRGEKTDVLNAAFVHAISSNILDFDDTHWATGIHPTGPVASALMAWAGHQPVSGQAFQHALLLGIEVACRIGLAVSPEHYRRGWHITSTCGIFGAAVAVGRLMKLSPLQMSWALGHAATQASGLVANLGSMAKSVNIGHAAKNGTLAAVLAQRNVTSNAHILEAPHGFAQVMGHNASMSPVLPVIDACLSLLNTRDISPVEIVSMELIVNPMAKLRAHRPNPKDGLEAKLSLEHAAAVCIVHQCASVSEFTDEAVHHPDVASLRQRVAIVTNESQSAEEATVTISCLDGGQHTQTVTSILGTEHHAMAKVDLVKKFYQLALYGAPHGDSDLWLRTAQNITTLDDASIFLKMTSL